MNSYIFKIFIKRIFSSLILLFLLFSFLFFLLRIAPGDPSDKYISPKLSPLLLEKARQTFNPTSSLADQYISFLENSVSGNLGISYEYHRPVTEVISTVLPFTIKFSVLAFIVQFASGFLLAFIVFRYAGKFMDKIITRMNFILFSTPAFVSGVLLIFIFSAKLGILPASGEQSLDYDNLSYFGKVLDSLWHLVLPVTCLALTGMPVYYKYFKEGFQENYGKLFVQYLRANGVSEKEILIKHILPNSINPVIAYAGVDLGMLFSSVLVTEVIFGLNGMGRLAVNSIISRDYPLVIGCTLTAAVLMIISNMLADFIRYKIDKRLIMGVMN